MGKTKHRKEVIRGIPNRLRPQYDLVRVSNAAYKPIYTVRASFGHLDFFGRGFHMTSAKRAALMEAQQFGLGNTTYFGLTKPLQDRQVGRHLIYPTGKTKQGIVHRTPGCVKEVNTSSENKNQMSTHIDIDNKSELPSQMVCNSKQDIEMQHDDTRCHSFGLPKRQADYKDANCPNTQDVDKDTGDVKQLYGVLKSIIPQPLVDNFNNTPQKSPANDFQEHSNMFFSDGAEIPKAAPNECARHTVNEDVIDLKRSFRKEEPVAVYSKTERFKNVLGENDIDVETVGANEIIACSEHTIVKDVIDLTQIIQKEETVDSGRRVKCSDHTIVEEIIDLTPRIPKVETDGSSRLVEFSEPSIDDDVIDLVQSIPKIEAVGASRLFECSEHTTFEEVTDLTVHDLTQSSSKVESDDDYELIEDNNDDFLDLTVGCFSGFSNQTQTGCLPIDHFLDMTSNLQNDGFNETQDDDLPDLNILTVGVAIPKNDYKQTLQLLAEEFIDLKIGFPRVSDDLSKQSVEKVEMLVDGLTGLTIEPLQIEINEN